MREIKKDKIFCSVDWKKQYPEELKERYIFLYNKFKNEFYNFLIIYTEAKRYWLEVDSQYERSLLLNKYGFKEATYEEVMK